MEFPRAVTFLTLALIACGSESPTALDATPQTDTLAVDASASTCLTRTAPAGEPEGPVPASAVHNGDYRISSQLDVDALAGIRVITGDLRVTDPSFAVLALPDLEVVGGNFFIEDAARTNLTEIALSKLQTIGGSTSFSAANAARVDLATLDSIGVEMILIIREPAVRAPCLRSISGELAIVDDAALSIELPRLETAGKVTVFDSSNVEAIELPALTSLATLDVRDNARLGSISAALVTTAANISIQRCPALATVSFDRLPSATGILFDTTNTDLSQGFDALTTITNDLVLVRTRTAQNLAAFANLTRVDNLTITDNPALLDLGLTALTTLTGVRSTIAMNPMLPTCQAEALRDRLGRPIEIVGNNDAGTCLIGSRSH